MKLYLFLLNHLDHEVISKDHHYDPGTEVVMIIQGNITFHVKCYNKSKKTSTAVRVFTQCVDISLMH